MCMAALHLWGYLIYALELYWWNVRKIGNENNLESIWFEKFGKAVIDVGSSRSIHLIASRG